jgi:hypothetical protein
MERVFEAAMPAARGERNALRRGHFIDIPPRFAMWQSL